LGQVETFHKLVTKYSPPLNPGQRNVMYAEALADGKFRYVFIRRMPPLSSSDIEKIRQEVFDDGFGSFW